MGSVGLSDACALVREFMDEKSFDIDCIEKGIQLSFCRKTIDVETIDKINILQATMLAMEQAVLNLKRQPDFVLVDGNRVPKGLNPEKIKALIKGDTKCYSIAAASIIAKVTRDRIMDTLHLQYPMYNFASHRGYGVPEHVRLIRKFGPSPAHRRSFKPTKEWFPIELQETDDGRIDIQINTTGKKNKLKLPPKNI